MKWFEFNQNNSGGSFDVTSELCHRVFIEAKDDVAALSKGLDMGIYLDGVADGIDCKCCGDRWHLPNEVDVPVLGYDRPFDTIEEYAQYLADHYGWTTPDIRLYYADGRKAEIFTRKQKKARR